MKITGQRKKIKLLKYVRLIKCFKGLTLERPNFFIPLKAKVGLKNPSSNLTIDKINLKLFFPNNIYLMLTKQINKSPFKEKKF